MNKYRNRKITIDNIVFASQKEGRRYSELKILQKIGTITDLRLQHPFHFQIGNCKIAKYIADFTYYDRDNGFIVEDCKGFKTPVYRLKRKLMKALYQIDIVEI